MTACWLKDTRNASQTLFLAVKDWRQQMIGETDQGVSTQQTTTWQEEAAYT